MASLAIVTIVSMFATVRVSDEQEDQGLDRTQHNEVINSEVAELSARRRA